MLTVKATERPIRKFDHDLHSHFPDLVSCCNPGGYNHSSSHIVFTIMLLTTYFLNVLKWQIVINVCLVAEVTKSKVSVLRT